MSQPVRISDDVLHLAQQIKQTHGKSSIRDAIESVMRKYGAAYLQGEYLGKSVTSVPVVPKKSVADSVKNLLGGLQG